ncbi:MAG: DUF87 domain-containing protein [Desulfurococcales archaeon]|nr:DUF87 domain-containing protein [Desulfurococcales archaeon]
MSEEGRMPITGFTTSIKEYSRVEGIILRPAEAIVKYGTLVIVRDEGQGKEFLSMIVDVMEETPHPALDVERIRDLYKSVTETRLEDANRVLMEMLSPTHQLIKWSSIMKVDLKVLGEISESERGESLKSYDRPPRPFSSIQEPDPKRLEKIIHADLGPEYKKTGLFIGKLSLNEDVEVYLNPARLNTHLSILAQTGAGKTETVKRLVAEFSWRRDSIKYPKGGIVVFDIAGEYTGHPFERPDTVPLIDAVLNPRNYGGKGGPPEKITILVPYELGRAFTEAQREELWKGLLDLACKLSRRTGKPFDVFLVHSNRRFWASVAGSPQGCKASYAGQRSKPSYSDFYNLLEASSALVVAMPLPGFATVEDLVDMTGTQSEYFEMLLLEMASSLDSIDGSDVYALHLLNSLAALRLRADIAPSKARALAERTVEALKSFCGTEPADEVSVDNILKGLLKDLDIAPRDEAMIRLSKDLFFTAMRYIAWLAYREDEELRRNKGERQALCMFLSSKEASEKVKKRLAEAVSILWGGTFEPGTLRSFRRALTKATRQMSGVVDTITFDALMKRLMEGFTIVHLAPPSMGNTDVFLGLLIRRLFMQHVGSYEEDRMTILVVEEAHNLAPAGQQRASKESLLRVAREGRKWGLSLWLVSQRPSFIDSSILSQAATSILLRTTNPEDLSMVKRSVESIAAEIVDRLPELEPRRGEALVTGLAAPERRIPLIINVSKLEKQAS